LSGEAAAARNRLAVARGAECYHGARRSRCSSESCGRMEPSVPYGFADASSPSRPASEYGAQSAWTAWSFREADADFARYMAEGRASSAYYASRVFLDRECYRNFYRLVAQSTDRIHSLSAAVQLMKTYGVNLSVEEERRLAQADEATQIDTLVSLMPEQSAEEFQQFFLQLQMLVSIAMRARVALEYGQTDEVAQAMEDAEVDRLGRYIYPVCIVQACQEALALRERLDEWARLAAQKLKRLMHSQQDFVAVQKRLHSRTAALDSMRSRYNNIVIHRCERICRRNDAVLRGIFFAAWWALLSKDRAEERMYAPFKERCEDLESQCSDVKRKHLERMRRFFAKDIMKRSTTLLSELVVIWRQDVVETKDERELQRRQAAFQELLAKKDDAKRRRGFTTMMLFAGRADQSVLEACFDALVKEVRDSKAQKDIQKASEALMNKIASFDKRRSKASMRFLKSMAGEADTGLLSGVIREWAKVCAEAKRVNDIAEQLQRQRQNVQSFATRRKSGAIGPIEKAIAHHEELHMLRVVGAWRLMTKMNAAIRAHQKHIDSKRQQLMGVQQMFRDFAKTLENGIHEDGRSTARLFERRDFVGNHRLARTEHTESMPTLRELPPSGRRPPSGAGPSAPRSSERRGQSPAMCPPPLSAPRSSRSDACG